LNILTTVKAVFNGIHTDPDNGAVHGHDYEVEAGWYGSTERFEVLKAKLAAHIATLDHRPMPHWSAEEMAPWLLERLGCDWLKISRPSIGHSVTVHQ